MIAVTLATMGAVLLTIVVVFSDTARVRAINGLLHLQARLNPADLAASQQASADWIPHGAVLILGDSIAAMLPPRAIDTLAVNLARGGARTSDVRKQLASLKATRHARALVLLVGTNDVAHGGDASDLGPALQSLPPSLPVLLCTIPPIDPAVHRDRNLARIAEINRAWVAAAAARPHTLLIRTESVLADDRGGLRRELHQGDGLHLNAEGSRRLTALIREALQKIPPP